MNNNCRFRFPSSQQLCLDLSYSLIHHQSLNEYMEKVLPLIGNLLGADRFCLVDYYENTRHFDLVFFGGYPPDYRFALQRRLQEMEIEKALSTRDPFYSSVNPNFLCIPFYFRDILEAVLVLEGNGSIRLDEEKREAAQIISRFLGLFMSSTRLDVNRRYLVDQNDLRRAREIQLNFLPKQHPKTQFLEAFGFNSSSNVVGGDYFDYFQAREDSIQCILADACGHGMAAALIMSNFRGLIQSEILRRSDFSVLFNSLNEMVYFDEELIQYLTGVFLHFDDRSKKMLYLNAGHYEPLIFGEKGFRTLPGSGPPLGMFKSSNYPVGEAELESGDLVALYTDGLADIRNSEDEYFGTEGIIEILSRYRERPLEEITKRVLDAARSFSGNCEFEDDLTLFLLRVQ